MRQLFFIEGKLLGESSRGLVRVHDSYQEPHSDLYFCACCGDVYARCPVMRADGSTTSWQSYRRVCRCCAVRSTMLSDWPGSVWRSWDLDFLAALPAPVLQWELERHIEAIERIGDYK